MGVYLNDWEEDGEPQMLSDFNVDASVLAGATVLVASYTYDDYSGSAYVLFERDGKLYEVHGSHCSCYGLEGQWEPEETFEDAIRHRLTAGTWGEEDRIKKAVMAALDGRTKPANDNAPKFEVAGGNITVEPGHMLKATLGVGERVIRQFSGGLRWSDGKLQQAMLVERWGASLRPTYETEWVDVPTIEREAA